ncbi:hypothetical protein [Kangiella sp.]|uniref:hypothetical protein n=1 Tax=Kangiella sp. TaxID=1920245 RepID=UPI0019C4C8B7|nr:hypothetical protein [Kangiella sp.]MBD3654194.1 hypothetical protein [Kangiella sp.]MBD3669112.1 hypothetical protein [Kangiella sp.]
MWLINSGTIIPEITPDQKGSQGLSFTGKLRYDWSDQKFQLCLPNCGSTLVFFILALIQLTDSAARTITAIAFLARQLAASNGD